MLFLRKKEQKINRKYSKENVSVILENLGYHLGDSFESMEQKTYIVDDDGYKYYTSLKDLIYRNKCPTKIYPGNIYSIDNIKNYIHLNDMSCELLTSEFVDSETKMDWRCECGSIFKMSWTKFYQGYNTCPKCVSKREFLNRKNKRYQEISQWCLENNFILLKIVYDKNNCFDYFEFLGLEGYKYMTRYKNYKRCKPLRYHRSNKYTIYNINRWLNSIGLNDYVCVNTDYNNNNTKLKFVHLDCMKIFEITLGKLQRKISENGLYICPHCYKKKSESYHASVLKQIFVHEYKNVVTEDRSCINPETKHALPTDIVCYDTKEVVEIQSSYHDLEYKVKLDAYKKRYWEARGFKVYTPDIRNYSVVEMIQLFFPNIQKVPDYVDVTYNSLPNYKLLQDLLNRGYSTKEVAKLSDVSVGSVRQAVYKESLYLPDNYKENVLNQRKIVQLDTNGKVINIYNNVYEADQNGYKAGTIRRVLNGTQKLSYGFIWKYESDYNIQQNNN